ncbi:hypothetical protein Nepgr_008065 [Nepenthes gracilis]|uniref:Uncharacterized protein n=1 Tax=Nepenthes gracilis TaxID=150966 RepID=A0AAD3XJ16_NEPGR|nr:hypothetical protein Nepgr_008065 [Nepenthes gracilis]
MPGNPYGVVPVISLAIASPNVDSRFFSLMRKLRCLRVVIRISYSGTRLEENNNWPLVWDLASSDVVDELLINPITTTSSIIHLSPDGKEALGDIVFSPLNVEGLQGYDISTDVTSISFADILKHGIHSKEVDEPGTCGAHQLPITDADHLKVLGGSFCHEGNVGSPTSGFALNTLKVFLEMEQLSLPILITSPRLCHSYQVVTDDHQDGDPTSSPNLGRKLSFGGEQNQYVDSMDSPSEGIGPISKKSHRPKKKQSPRFQCSNRLGIPPWRAGWNGSARMVWALSMVCILPGWFIGLAWQDGMALLGRFWLCWYGSAGWVWALVVVLCNLPGLVFVLPECQYGSLGSLVFALVLVCLYEKEMEKSDEKVGKLRIAWYGLLPVWSKHSGKAIG